MAAEMAPAPFEEVSMRLAPLTLVLLLPLSIRSAEPPAQWVVVTAPAFRAALGPLIEHRKDQGLKVIVVPTTDVLTAAQLKAGEADKLRDHVRKLCKEHKGTSYVLLVGAIEAGKLVDAETK